MDTRLTATGGAEVDVESDNLQSNRQFKTLILTDLCDSVMLVERIGDAAAADLFRKLDAQVLQLLRRWNGRLIDRSDGMFLLFDAPVDGLGFALDYVDELDALGRELKLPLQARVGVHVGYVLSWHNSEEAVAAGAKALEVEGLAKPMAARLMALARPGQILMSSAAESMMRSGQRELGDRGTNLQWKSHGRWRFKGMPTGQEVFEVGRKGRAPLRMPTGSAKARRELPLWRRPVALVAEIALLAVVVAVTWVLVRPESAIAFAERDWVVLADIRNLSGDPLLDDGLEQALRISLEQSRYVNVISDLKVRDSLQRMQQPDHIQFGKEVAAQLALRDGARAVLEATVLEVNGNLRVSLDVIDPTTLQTVYTVRSEGKGLGSVLASTDNVVSQLRSRLGEALADVRKASTPLPQVATSDLDALHAYAKGQMAYGQGDVASSLRYYDVAISIDPQFAMAYLGKMRSLAAQGRRDDAREVLDKARALRKRLSTRDALYMDAWGTELSTGSETAALGAWKTLAELYPDYHAPSVNQALAEFALGHYAAAERAVSRVNVPQNGLRSAAYQLLGRVQLAQGKAGPALESLNEAMAQADGRPNRYLVDVFAATGDMDSANAVQQKLPADGPGAWLQGTALALDEGRTSEAVRAASAASRQCTYSTSVCEFLAVLELTVHAAADSCVSPNRLRQTIQPLLLAASGAEAIDRGQRVYFAAAAMYAAQRLGMGAQVRGDIELLKRLAGQAADPRSAQLVALVEANDARLSGDATEAARQLNRLLDGSELYQVHSVLAATYRDLRDEARVARELDWMWKNRGLAYAEYAGTSTLQPLNVRDSRQGPSEDSCQATGPAAITPAAVKAAASARRQ